MTEKWRIVPSFRDYIVSDFGRIRHRSGIGPILKGSYDRDGYRRVNLNGCTLRVHVIVAEAFHGRRPAGLQIAHLDNDPQNNRCVNLAYVTAAENNSHKAIFGTHQDHSCERHPQAKLSDAQADEIKRRAKAGEPGRALAREFGINQSQVSRIATNKRRQHRQASPEPTPPTQEGPR